MSTKRQQSFACEIEDALGNPRDVDAPISFVRSVALDQESLFPHEEFQAVVAAGLQKGYVPTSRGGKTDDFADVMMAVRAVARRDLTAAIGHGKTFLGAVCSWDSASDETAARVAEHTLAGESISWGLTERGHGSDLLSTSVMARKTSDGGWALNGEKWMINNATRGRALTILARTGDEPGPRSLSLFYMDKEEAQGTWEYLPKIQTHGIRGADISGITLRDTKIPQGRLIGAPGDGLEIVLRCLQVTRPLCTALSLGAADSGLSAALEFAAGRNTMGHILLDLPAAQDQLADVAVDLAIAELMSVMGARHLQLNPSEASVISPSVKYLVPHIVDDIMVRITRFIGARAVLADGQFGHVQKTVRDNRVVSIFDGNSVVNLHSIVQQLPRAVRYKAPLPEATPESLISAENNTPLNYQRLMLMTTGGATMFSSLTDSANRASDALDGTGRDMAVILVKRAEALAEEAKAMRPVRNPEPEGFRLAHEFTVLLAASAVLEKVATCESENLWSDPGIASMALRRLIKMLNPQRASLPRKHRNKTKRERESAYRLLDQWRQLSPGYCISAFTPHINA